MKHDPGKKKNKIAFVMNLTGVLLLIAVIAICIPISIPRLFGYEMYTVISGSMEPAIPTGSLVYVEQIEASEVEEGDVIAFYSSSDNGSIITHRVVANQVVSGRFITKGDANEAEDTTPVEYDRLIGVVAYTIPVLGRILAVVVTPAGKIGAACVVVFATVLHIIAGRLREVERV